MGGKVRQLKGTIGMSSLVKAALIENAQLALDLLGSDSCVIATRENTIGSS